MTRLPARQRGPLSTNGIVVAALPAGLRASLDSMLADDPAVSVRLRCQVRDVRRGDSPISGSRSGAARPTPPLSPVPPPPELE